jgi:carbon-monoxide dehydrogenase medium subunit
MLDLPDLEYSRPRALSEALDALSRPGSCVYAGGTDLLLALSARAPWTVGLRRLVDVKTIPEARGITDAGDHLRIGALVTAAELADDHLVRREAPALAQAAAATAAPALRRRGTVGGNIAMAHPAADVTTALLALDARVASIDVGGSAEVEELSLENVLSSWDRTERTRLLLSVTIAKQPRCAFTKFPSRLGFGRSLVCVGMAVDGERVRVALGGLAERPVHAVEVSSAVQRQAALADALAHECHPADDDVCASPAYRLRLAATLIERLHETLR